MPVPSLDLYRADDPFRTPGLREYRDWIDVVEYAYLCTAAFPEPLTFSLRMRRLLAAQAGSFDVVHDNQCLGWGMLGVHRAGLPVVASVHHAVVIDRDFELAREHRLLRRLTLRRWYQFHRMQDRVARRMERVITVSEQSRRDIVEQDGRRPGAHPGHPDRRGRDGVRSAAGDAARARPRLRGGQRRRLPQGGGPAPARRRGAPRSAVRWSW